MAKTNGTNPNTTMPSLRRKGQEGAGTARRSGRNKPAAVPRSLRKPPPESLLEAQGAPDMPSRVARPRAYPSRNNRTPSTNPPAVVICNEETAPGDVSVLNFRSPTLPPFASGFPDAFLHEEGLELEFGKRATAGGGDDSVDDNIDRTRKGKAASRTRKGKPASCGIPLFDQTFDAFYGATAGVGNDLVDGDNRPSVGVRDDLVDGDNRACAGGKSKTILPDLW
jgi:hypothetical protein